MLNNNIDTVLSIFLHKMLTSEKNMEMLDVNEFTSNQVKKIMHYYNHTKIPLIHITRAQRLIIFFIKCGKIIPDPDRREPWLVNTLNVARV